MERSAGRMARLYEQGADARRIGAYARHWWRWVRAGVRSTDEGWNHLRQLLRGDLGQSIINRTRVLGELRYCLSATVEMIFGALIIGMLVGVSVGVVSAIRRNSWFDVMGMIGALLGDGLRDALDPQMQEG